MTFSFQKDKKGNASKIIVHAFGQNFEQGGMGTGNEYFFLGLFVNGSFNLAFFFIGHRQGLVALSIYQHRNSKGRAEVKCLVHAVSGHHVACAPNRAVSLAPIPYPPAALTGEGKAAILAGDDWTAPRQACR